MEKIIIGLIILAAVLYALRHFWKTAHDGTCSGCSAGGKSCSCIKDQ